MLRLALLGSVLGHSLLAIEIPEGDAVQLLLKLLTQWNSLSPLAIGAILIVIAVQALKALLGDFKFKRVVIVALGIVYAIIQSRIQGLDLSSSIVMALFSSGGAVALFEAIKPLIKAKA